MSASKEIQVFPFEAMASRCEIQIAALAPGQAALAARQAIAEVRRIEHKYSRYRDDSIVSRINAAAGGEALVCDAETLSLLDYAASLYDGSDGLFDITSGVLRRAWNFREPKLPAAGEIERLLALVDGAALERDGDKVRLPRAGMEIDFGGFGKEYAADRAASRLVESGCRHGFVNLGGDLRAFGPQPDGSPWRFGIRDPRKADETIASLDVMQGALATSGDYERFFDLDGRRYCHVLDPRTGWPVSHWRSVSVLAPLAVAAGSLTTIAMLRGAAALDYLTDAGVSWVAVDSQGRVRSHDR